VVGKNGWASSSSSNSDKSGSSPERYLSDYDEDGNGILSYQDRQEEEHRRMRGMRRGSEGWEVRPVEAGWNHEAKEGRGRHPWEEEGRYNVYEPDEDRSESDDDWGYTGGVGDVSIDNVYMRGTVTQGEGNDPLHGSIDR